MGIIFRYAICKKASWGRNFAPDLICRIMPLINSPGFSSMGLRLPRCGFALLAMTDLIECWCIQAKRYMATNVTPDYRKAEDRYREAGTTEEKILALEEMLRLIPKHKGSEHLQADLKKKLSKLKEAPKQKAGGKQVDIFYVPKGGAGQVVLLGLPNSGKSSLVGALSKAKVQIADFPFATNAPVPGMAKFEDVPIQLVDMPPITAEFVAPGQVGTYRNCDLIGVLIDLTADIEEQWQVCIDYLESKDLITRENQLTRDENGNSRTKPFFCLGTKVDEAGEGLLELLAETTDYQCEFMEISTTTGHNLDAFMAKLFAWLDVIRVYAKPPGKPVDKADPFTLPRGANVQDLACLVHRELAEKLKTARVWGEGVHDGQHVQLHHELHDKDVVELHFP